MRRREFIAGLGAAALTARQRTASAQQRAMPVVGILHAGSVETDMVLGSNAAVFRGLAEAGYVEGRNFTVEYRWAEGRYDRLSPLADPASFAASSRPVYETTS